MSIPAMMALNANPVLNRLARRLRFLEAIED